MTEEIISKVTPCGDLIRATVFTPQGSSSKTCRTMGEVNAFIALVKTKRTWVTRRRPTLVVKDS